MEQGILKEGTALDRIVVEPPREESHGDMATNGAMVLSKEAGMNPRNLAELFAKEIEKIEGVTSVTIAGPGFINWTLSEDFWLSQLKEILKEGDAFGDLNLGHGQSINLEYVSCNPTGPMHMGHCRGAVVGDVLAHVLQKVGYQVTKEFYINDAGGQAKDLARSAYQRYLEALGLPRTQETTYGGDYLVPVGKALAEKYGNSFVGKDESEWLESVQKDSMAMMMDRIKADLKELHIQHDIFASEAQLLAEGKVEAAIDTLTKDGLIYEGILEKPKGMDVEDWEPRPQMLFRATQFGDDVDRPLQKSDGSWTYFANDIAYHYVKFLRGSPVLLNIWGADHGGYVKRMQAAVQAITKGKGSMRALLCQMVRFIDKGQILKMSKREGNFITIKDAIDKVGLDAIRFMMVSRKSDGGLDFDFDRVIEQSKDNPVFYVQYAYARCHSVKRHIQEQFPELSLESKDLMNIDWSPLKQEAFLALIKKLMAWPRYLEQAAQSYETQKICGYMGELAALLHGIWTQGKDQLSLRFIDPQDPLKTQAHYALLKGLLTVMDSGFKILGIEPKETM